MEKEPIDGTTLLIRQHWEDLVSPAPSVVNLLGTLLVAAKPADFSMRETPPVGGFKYIEQPDSFQATLAQLSGSCSRAFVVSHRSMETIHDRMKKVPHYVKKAFKALRLKNKRVSQQILNLALGRLKEGATVCKTNADKTVNAFNYTLSLLGEIQVTTVARHSLQKKQLAEVKQNLTLASLSLAQAQEELEEYTKREKEVRDEVKKSKEQFDKAMKAIPSTAQMLGLKLLGGVISLITNGVNRAVKSFGDSKGVRGKPLAVQVLNTLEHPFGVFEKAVKGAMSADDLKNLSGNCETYSVFARKARELLAKKNTEESEKTSKAVLDGIDFCRGVSSEDISKGGNISKNTIEKATNLTGNLQSTLLEVQSSIAKKISSGKQEAKGPEGLGGEYDGER